MSNVKSMEDKTSPSPQLSKGARERINTLGEYANQLAATSFNSANGMIDPARVQATLLEGIAGVSAVVTQLLKNGDIPHPPTNEMVYKAIAEITPQWKEPHA